MRGRTTFLTVCVVALVALATTAGITLLHRQASRARVRYETLFEVQASANRLGTLDWEAEAQRSVPMSVEAEVNATLPQMRARLVGLLDDGEGITTPPRGFDAYRPAVQDGPPARRGRDFAEAETKEDRVQATSERPRDGLRTAAARNARAAD